MTAENCNFRKSVLHIVSQIPKGETLTYKEVAEKAGHPKAARAVGSLLKKNFDTSVPCHRVIKSDGTPGDYNRGGSKAKRNILREEGVYTT